MLLNAFSTVRLFLRPIAADDAGAIFDSYAQDTTVTRFLIWRPHRSRSETEAYVAQCIATPPEISRTYVLIGREDGLLRGAFALRLAAPHRSRFWLRFGTILLGRGLMTEGSPTSGCGL